MFLKLSIITICFNEVDSVAKTLASVAGQTFKNFEWIVIDGGSTDGTLEILNTYRSHFTVFISEKDAGIYNAMNKGIARAQGEYLFFLNGGDYLADDGTLSRIFSTPLDADFVYGDITVIGGERPELLVMPSKITAEFLYRKTIPHQSTLTKKDLFERAGTYDERFKIVADYEFILRGLLHFNATFQYVPLAFACYSGNGVSSDAVRRKAEKTVVHKRYYSLLQRIVLKHKIRTKLLKLRRAINWPEQKDRAT
jgi:glycosyltransferase involved in cell wall biosynthesis